MLSERWRERDNTDLPRQRGCLRTRRPYQCRDVLQIDIARLVCRTLVCRVHCAGACLLVCLCLWLCVRASLYSRSLTDTHTHTRTHPRSSSDSSLGVLELRHMTPAQDVRFATSECMSRALCISVCEACSSLLQ